MRELNEFSCLSLVMQLYMPSIHRLSVDYFCYSVLFDGCDYVSESHLEPEGCVRSNCSGWILVPESHHEA